MRCRALLERPGRFGVKFNCSGNMMAYFEIVVVVILTFINGLLAMSELAIASSRLPKLRLMVEQSVHGSRRALVLALDPGRFLSTVQIGITLIGIVAGAVSGAALGHRASLWFAGFGLSETVSEALGYGVVIGAITYLSLIIGELVPKRIALRNPERIACLVAPGMTILAKVSAPIVWLLDRSGRIVLALLGQSKAREDKVTDEEIHSMIAEAELAGVIEPEERSMIAGVMRLGDRPVRSVMIPRADVVMIDINDPPSAVGKKITASGHSRFVAYDGKQDNIVGVLQAKDVAVALLRKKMPTLKSLVKKAPIVPDTVDALDVVNKLKDSDVHFGLIYDEYGHFEGIVTEADILEAIVGVFREEHGVSEADIVERDDGSLLVAGWAPVEPFMERISVQVPERRDYQTVAGFMLDKMGRLPQIGESFIERMATASRLSISTAGGSTRYW
jgi:putative hemolysin